MYSKKTQTYPREWVENNIVVNIWKKVVSKQKKN